MKKKLLICIFLMIIIGLLFLNIYKVEAFTDEIDSNNYVTLPSQIWTIDKVGTGTITLSSSASGYNMAYQKVDITKEEFNSIDAKNKELENYIESSNKTIKEKETNLTTLQTEYQNIQNSGTATEEELLVAKTKYDQASAEYTEYLQNAKAQVEKLEKEYFELLPDYTSSWKTATNSSDNVKLDFSNYTGKVYFILYVKITNGTNTYYNFDVYSNEIKKDETKNTTNEDGTDFSKAKFKLKKEGVSDAIVEISGVTPKEDGIYYLIISANKTKPSIDSKLSKQGIVLKYDKSSKIFKTSDASNVAKYVELNQELYASVVENGSIVTYGNKLTRFSESKYSDAFSATFMTNDKDQIVTNFTHNKSNNRKIQIKVGKITNTSILKKIKSKNKVGFEELLNYAKSNSSIFNKTVNADKNDWYAIQYNAGTNTSTGNSVINLKGLKNKEYYFLYIKTDDENGKYVSNEAVTLAQANVRDNGWSLFFYGSSDFKWTDWKITNTGTSSTPSKLPNTGIETIILGGLFLTSIAGGIIFYKKYKKYNF